MKKIEIVFKDKTLKGIAGNDFGYETFNKYKEDIENNSEIEIVFPKDIILVVPSFIQGFSRDIKERYIKGQIIITGGVNNCVKKYFDEELKEMDILYGN